MDRQKYGWTGKKMKEQKRSSKTIDIVSYALKVSVNGVICVFVAHFRSSGTSESSSTCLTVNIHVSTKTCVIGNNFILHKALSTPMVQLYVAVKLSCRGHHFIHDS